MRKKFIAGNYGYGHAKKELLEAILEYFGEARARREELEKNPEYVEKVLRDGQRKAREIAAKKMTEVKKAIGLHGNIYR